MQEKTALDVKFKDLSRLKNHRSDYSTILGGFSLKFHFCFNTIGSCRIIEYSL